MIENKILEILKNKNMTIQEKSEILGWSTDKFYQNIYDMGGNVVQESYDIEQYDFKDILRGETLEGKTVLDLGCNCGSYLFEALKLGAKKVIGVDKQDCMSKFIKHLGITDRAEFYKQDILNYDSSPVEITFIINVLAYLSNNEIEYLIDKMKSYTKEKIYMVDIFSRNYAHQYNIVIDKLERDKTKYEIYKFNHRDRFDVKVIEIRGEE